jgi:hypothetical protein
MIQPTNGHLLVKPMIHQTLLPTEKGHFDEIGEVVDWAMPQSREEWEFIANLEVGDKVFYDSWLAAKYPSGEGDEEIWLIPFKDVRAVQKKDA